MFGESPITVPLSFESTKYPTMVEKIKTLQRNREEALAAHKLARSRMANRRNSTFTPFKQGDQVWLDSRSTFLSPRSSDQNHSEPLRTDQNHSELLRTTQNYSEPLRITQNHSELLRTTLILKIYIIY